MARPRTADPGFTRLYEGPLRRVINQDGRFNVRRIGTRLSDFHIYHFLARIPWPAFIAILVSGYMVMNALFALL